MHNIPKWSGTIQNSCSIFYKIFKVCLTGFGHYAKGLKVKKMSEAKTESKSFLFHIGNEFPNMIRVTSEVGFYVKAFQLRNLHPDFCKIFLGRFSLTPTQ